MKKLLLVLLFVAATCAAGVPPLKAAVKSVEDVDYIDVYAASASSSPTSTEPSTEAVTVSSSSAAASTESATTQSGSTFTSDGSSPSSDGMSPGTTPDTISSTSTPKPGGGDDGLSPGAIAGIVIGSLAGVALIGGGIFFMKKKKMACFQ